VIRGYVPSDPFESLIVGYYERDKMIYVAKVRNGFVPRVAEMSHDDLIVWK
jgi:hypothetical protein